MREIEICLYIMVIRYVFLKALLVEVDSNLVVNENFYESQVNNEIH